MARTISLRIGVGGVQALSFVDPVGSTDSVTAGLVGSSPFTYIDARFTDNGDGTWTSSLPTNNSDGTWSI